jgi:hypothetical protein
MDLTQKRARRKFLEGGEVQSELKQTTRLTITSKFKKREI